MTAAPRGARGALRSVAHRVWRLLPTWTLLLSPLPRERNRKSSASVENVTSLPVQPGVRLDVCWLKAPFGPGPAASLYAGGHEIMRLDCLGGERGHMHLGIGDAQRLSPAATPRLAFPTGTMEEHVERAAFELEHNAAFAVATSLRRSVRALALDPEDLRQAAAEMRAAMLELVARHGGEPAAGRPAAGE